MSIADDIVQFGTTQEGKLILSYLVNDCKFFETQLTAIKFSISIAIKNNLQEDTTTSFSTSHHVTSLDSDDTLKEMITTIFPDQTRPYYFAQILCDNGLHFIEEQLGENPKFTDLIKLI